MNEPTSGITTGVLLKNLAYIPAAIIAVGLDINSYLILAIFLLFDLFTGVWRSIVIEGLDSLRSWKGINGFFSKFLFLSVPIVVAYMGHGIGMDMKSMAQMALGVLLLFTGYSILGNIYSIRSGKPYTEPDAMRYILKVAQGVLDKYTVPPDHKK